MSPTRVAFPSGRTAFQPAQAGPRPGIGRGHVQQHEAEGILTGSAVPVGVPSRSRQLKRGLSASQVHQVRPEFIEGVQFAGSALGQRP
jgi:hypothetical protein